MDYYTLDENDCPRLADMESYYKWKKTLPEEMQTGIGFTLACTESDDVMVSTVYLGLDHAFGLEPPVLWETMLFCSGENNNTCERSTNRKSAMLVHQQFCEKYIQSK